MQVLRNFSEHQGTDKGKYVTPGVLVTQPLNEYKGVRQICTGHAKKSYYKNNISRAEDFRAKDIVTQLSVGWRKQTESVPVHPNYVKAVPHCCKQDVALRGDNESRDLSFKEPPVNESYFLACLRLRLQAGNINPKKHRELCPKNCHELSWKV